MKVLTRLRVPLGFVLAGWFLLVSRPASRTALVAAGGLILTGCALRSWAAGYLLKGKRVAVGGPYARVRNPLYLGSFIIATGFCVALAQRPLPASIAGLWAAFFLGYGVLYSVKTLAEERELTADLGQPYLDYASRVPAFIPWKGRVSGLGEQSFSVELFKRNREYQCWLGSASLYGLLWVRYALGF